MLKLGFWKDFLIFIEVDGLGFIYFVCELYMVAGFSIAAACCVFFLGSDTVAAPLCYEFSDCFGSRFYFFYSDILKFFIKVDYSITTDFFLLTERLIDEVFLYWLGLTRVIKCFVGPFV